MEFTRQTFFQIIVRFGGRLTDIGRECTHIVFPRVTRTVKFLSGISVCHHIVTPEWVEECGRVGRLVDEGGYVLRDRDAEEMFNMNIAVSLARAKKKQLLTVSIMHTFRILGGNSCMSSFFCQNRWDHHPLEIILLKIFLAC